MAHHGVCCRKDMASRAVVLFELDHFGIGKILLEIEDVGDVGATPRVNRLVVVAHDHQVLVLGSEQICDLVLNVVRVLILVHADVAESLLVLFEHLGTTAQKLERAHQQVIEIHGVCSAQATLQLGIDARGLFLLRTRRTGTHLIRADHGIFRRRDLGADHVDGILLLLDGERLHDVAYHAARIVVVVDGELAGIAQKVCILTKHAHAHGVERAHPHAARALRQKRAQALAHLGSRLVGKGDGENLPGAHAQIGNHVSDAERKHASLAGACAGKHQKRTLGGEYGLALSGIERIDIDGVRHEQNSIPDGAMRQTYEPYQYSRPRGRTAQASPRPSGVHERASRARRKNQRALHDV